MTNHNIDTSNNFMTPNMYRAAGYTALALGVVVTGNVIVNTFQSDPEYDIKNHADISAPVVVDLPELSTHSDEKTLYSTVDEGEATSIAVEQATLQLADAYDIQLQKGQSAIDLQSAQNIDYAVRTTTGGSVKPGTELKSQLDPETGYVVTTYVVDDTK